MTQLLTEFDAPPADPLPLAVEWFDRAVAAGVREAGVVALATASATGRVSNRVVQTIAFTAAGWVFTSHAGSQKGRDLAATGWASGVFYWRETGEQLIIAGPVEPLSDAASDALWSARNPSTHPMSVAARQSEPLDDEDALRVRARELGERKGPLARPDAWLGYELVPTMVEFWRSSPDRLHRRLRYDRVAGSWTSGRLQP